LQVPRKPDTPLDIVLTYCKGVSLFVGALTPSTSRVGDRLFSFQLGRYRARNMTGLKSISSLPSHVVLRRSATGVQSLLSDRAPLLFQDNPGVSRPTRESSSRPTFVSEIVAFGWLASSAPPLEPPSLRGKFLLQPTTLPSTTRQLLSLVELSNLSRAAARTLPRYFGRSPIWSGDKGGWGRK